MQLTPICNYSTVEIGKIWENKAMPASNGIASIGELLVEFVCADKDGHHRRVGTYSGPYASGAPGIFIDQAARCGGRCIFAGAVGDDAFGQVILERLKADGVDTSLIAKVSGVPTGSAFVSYNADGSRDFVYNIVHSAASQFVADHTTIEKLVNFGTGVMHVSGSVLASAAMREKVLRVCKAMHGRGAAISFDPNIRKELISDPDYFTTVNELMATSTYFLPSEEDADVLFPGESLKSYAPKLFAKGTEYVVLKKGDKGSSGIHRGGETYKFPAHKVAVADPTGAGDCFCATFITLISSENYSFQKALQYANAAGALAVTKVGPMEGNSTLAEIEAFLALRA
jgi:sugar/nucleoside kinase (ribokinase family)